MEQNQHCGFLIKQIHDALEKQANNDLRKQDLTMAQVAVLLALDDLPNKQATLKVLESILRVAQSTTVGIIARLEQKGLVEGFGDPSDKRIKMVKMTASGETCCAGAKDSMDMTEQALLSALTEDERITFYQLLQKVSQYMK